MQSYGLVDNIHIVRNDTLILAVVTILLFTVFLGVETLFPLDVMIGKDVSCCCNGCVGEG